MVDPIIVNQHKDRKDIIIGGHQRARIWKELGNTTIPTVEEKLELDKEKELNVRLNKNVGEWDFDELSNNFEVEDLEDWGFCEDELSTDKIDDMESGDEIKIDKSLQVLPKNEYIIITEKDGSDEWEELKLLLRCKTVRAGGCTIGSRSDKAMTGLERVFNLQTFKERIGI